MHEFISADDGSERIVSTDAGPLYARSVGRGKVTIVFWPSIFTDHRIYDVLLDHIVPQARVLLIDGPGHGQSGDPGDYVSMAACGQAMLQVMDAFEVDRAVIGGTSWGGIVAVHAALAAPTRAIGLVLMNTPMQLNRHSLSLQARLIAAGSRWLLWTKTFRDGVARSFFAPETLRANPVYAAQFDKMLRDADPRALGRAVGSVMLRSDPLMPKLSGVMSPTLVIAGRDDPMYPIEIQAEAAELLPNGRLIAVDGRHISVVEAPDEVAAAVSSFLADVAV